MTGVDFSLLIGALICALISWRNRRGLMWIGAGAASYTVSTLAWRMHIPGAEVITALGDAAVCLAIYFFAKYRWELWVWRLFQISVGVSILYLASLIGVTSRVDHGLYAISLEAINWLVLLSIGGTAALQGMGLSHVLVRRPWDSVRTALLAVWAERCEAPFHRVRR